MDQLIISKLHEIKLLIAGFLVCTFLLAMRIKVTESYTFIFLGWNIFLAFIPYVITLLLQIHKNWQRSTYIWLPFAGVWLLFLPNTPYLISDLQHLRHSDPSTIWMDALLLTTFVWYAFLIFFLTVRDMQNIIRPKIKAAYIHHLTISVFILCGFGIYLGRFLRWNSWDIIKNPLALLYDICIRVRHPFAYYETWMVTFGYTLITTLVFYGMLSNAKNNNS